MPAPAPGPTTEDSRPATMALHVPPPEAVLPVTPEGTDLAHVIPADSTGAFRGLRHLPLKTVERISKINKVGRRQDRVFIFTSTHLFSTLPSDGDVQRAIQLDAITEVRVFRPRLEVAIVCASEYDILAVFHDSRSLMRALAVIKAYSAANFRDEPTPISVDSLVLEKPPQFARAPLPVPQITFRPWTSKDDTDGLGPGSARSSQRPPMRNRPGSPASLSGPGSPSFTATAEPAPSAFTGSPKKAQSGRAAQWSTIEAVEVGENGDTSASGVGRTSDAAGTSAVAVKAPAVDLDTSSFGAPSGTRHQDTQAPLAPSNSFHHPETAPSEASAGSRTPSMRGRGAVFGGGKRQAQSAPRLFNEQDDEPESSEQRSFGGPASPRGATESPRTYGGMGPSNGEAEETIRTLREQLRKEREASAGLARELTDVLRSKAHAEATLRAEADSLRLQLERMTATCLRLRRPWALDL